MFNFLSMIDNYEDRKVARDEYPWGFVSTCSVSDGEHKFETAVEHKQYGGMVIVEAYDTKHAAVAGHKKWMATMTAEKLPDTLTDCANAGIAQLLVAVSGEAITKARS